nr:MAG TPA: hypothetical protein [Caudoviricetes sp.]
MTFKSALVSLYIFHILFPFFGIIYYILNFKKSNAFTVIIQLSLSFLLS